jgi:hypothetical protein
LNQVAKIALAILKSVGAVLAMPFQAIHRQFVNQKGSAIGKIEKQLKDLQRDRIKLQSEINLISLNLHSLKLNVKCFMTRLQRELQAFSYHDYAFKSVDKQQDEAFFGRLNIETNEPIESLKEKLIELEQYVESLENRKIYKSEDSLRLSENHQAVIDQKGGRLQWDPKRTELFEKLNEDLNQESLQTLDLFAQSFEKLESYQRDVKAGFPSETNCSQRVQKLISGLKEEFAKVAECIEELKKTLQEFRAYNERDFVDRFVKFKSSVDSLENYTDNVACFVASTTPYNSGEHEYLKKCRELLTPSKPLLDATHATGDEIVAASEPSPLGGGEAADPQDGCRDLLTTSMPLLDATHATGDAIVAASEPSPLGGGEAADLQEGWRELLTPSMPLLDATHATEDAIVATREPSSLGGGQAADLQQGSDDFPALSRMQQHSVPRKPGSNRQHNRAIHNP